MVAAIGVKNAGGGRVAWKSRYVESPNSEILFHPVACRPADDATTEQVDDDGQIKSPFSGPYITDFARPFTIDRTGNYLRSEMSNHRERLRLLRLQNGRDA